MSRLDNLDQAIKQKDFEADKISSNQNKQRERERGQLLQYEEELNRLQRLTKDLISENEKLKKDCHDRDTLRKNDLDDKRALQEETFTVENKINKLAERLDLNMTALEIEQQKRFASESELEKCKFKIDKLIGHEAELEGENRILKRELDELRLMIGKNLENEHANNL